MSNPSFYWTLFKKFQTMGHVAEGTYHGAAPGPGGVNFTNPVTLFTLQHAGINLLGATTATSPLWGVLNAKASGSGAFEYPAASGTIWQPMPFTAAGGAVAAWADFGGAPLVSAFGTWIGAGSPNDFPAFVVAPNGGTVPSTDAGGSKPFVCSYASDDGTVGAVPADFWATSLIYLVDPATGAQANPTTLHAAAEYYVAAVVGNRGDAAGGRYAANPTTAQSPELQAQAWALTFGTGGASPAVQLPALSNLDPTSPQGVYDIYSLKSAKYDIVGFRMPVQLVFDGLVHAINDAVTAGTFTLPVGVSAETWLKTPPSHVCVKVATRRDDQAWPAYDASPQTERRIAQRNLVVFDVDLAAPSPTPNINWKYFTAGGPLSALLAHLQPNDKELGINELIVDTDLDDHAKILLAIPEHTFERWFHTSKLQGFKVHRGNSCDKYRVPFLDHVVLELEPRDKENRIELPFLDDHVLPLAIGIQFEKARFHAGASAKVSVRHLSRLPIWKKGRCYEIETITIGGFTIELRFVAPQKHGTHP